MPVDDIVPEIAVLIAAILILLAASFISQDRQWLGAPLALAGLVVAALLLTLQFGETRFTFSGAWVIDGASIWARLMIVGATAFTVLITPPWLESDRRHGEYYAILLFSALGAMGKAGAGDLLQLIIAVLLSSVTGYTLAAYHRNWPLSVEAGMKYFLIGAFANTMLALGVTLMFGLTGSTSFVGIADNLATRPMSPLLLLGTGLILVGLAFKIGAVPAHAWMPDVAEGAPAPAAAFLTVVPKLGATIVLARLVSLFPPDISMIRPLIAALAVLTMTLGNLAALWQDDVRRLIGWSSVSQSGYALMAVSVMQLSGFALPALLFFLLGYTAANLTAFAAVAHLRGRTDRLHYAGLARTQPLAATALVISFLSLVGIPPLAGFVGKLALFATTIEGGYAWLAVVALANTVISLFYYLRIIGPIYFGSVHDKALTLGRWTAVAVSLGLFAVVAIGLVAQLSIGAFTVARLLP